MACSESGCVEFLTSAGKELNLRKWWAGVHVHEELNLHLWWTGAYKRAPACHCASASSPLPHWLPNHKDWRPLLYSKAELGKQVEDASAKGPILKAHLLPADGAGGGRGGGDGKNAGFSMKGNLREIHLLSYICIYCFLPQSSPWNAEGL